MCVGGVCRGAVCVCVCECCLSVRPCVSVCVGSGGVRARACVYLAYSIHRVRHNMSIDRDMCPCHTLSVAS